MRAAPGDAGRTCPFCRFALKSGAHVVRCHACAAIHHTECWEENGGCAITGCAGGPGHEPAAWPDAPPAAVEPPPPPVIRAAPQPAPARANRALAAAIAVLALAIAGVAAAVVMTRPDTQAAVAMATPVADEATASAEPVETPDATTPDPTRTAEPEPSSTPEPTVEAAPSPREQIEQVLVAYYGNVLAGDFDAAWRLLSPTYRAWKRSEGGGYSKWVAQEDVHRERLDASGLHVRIRSVDGDVATVYVSGMRFRGRSNPDCNFRGVTWARRSGGRWLYDQGYLQNPDRAAMWRPRRTETLGYVCEVDGY